MFFPDTEFIIMLTRTLNVMNAFTNYLGWLLPERVAKLLIKEEK